MAQHQRPRPKILFVSESVTLAHFARPFALSNMLSDNDYDIHFACASPYRKFLHGSKHTLSAIYSIPPEQFRRALAKGEPVYNYATLKKYTEEDLALIDKVKPDLIIGDFRISLGVSARLAKIPYATISNAYWSPYAPKQYPTPCLPFIKYVGLSTGDSLFKLVAPFAFKAHALPMRRLRNYFGLPKMKLDLRQVYTEADYTLYADIPPLFPLNNAPDNHFFIGPILWSPSLNEPDWWHKMPTNRPIIYVSMGSSGSQQALQTVLNAFSKEEVTIIASGVETPASIQQLSTFFTNEYLDGNAASERADLVICNGGSLTCQQAFAHGKPVLGIATNMDQFLNMAGVCRVGAGFVLRADNLTENEVLKAYHTILNNSGILKSVENLQKEMKHWAARKRFLQFISSLTG